MINRLALFLFLSAVLKPLSRYRRATSQRNWYRDFFRAREFRFDVFSKRRFTGDGFFMFFNKAGDWYCENWQHADAKSCPFSKRLVFGTLIHPVFKKNICLCNEERLDSNVFYTLVYRYYLIAQSMFLGFFKQFKGNLFAFLSMRGSNVISLCILSPATIIHWTSA